MSCKLIAEQIYIFVGTKSENEFGTKTFQIALNINCDLVLSGVELQGVRGITIREGACHRGVQAAALLHNGVWLQGRGRGQRHEEGAGRRGLQAAG